MTSGSTLVRCADAPAVIVGASASGSAVVRLLDSSGKALKDLDKTTALEFADHIVRLAAQLPDPPRSLRRRPGTDEHLRSLEP